MYLSGQDINRLPTRQVARQMAILPQVHEVPAGLTVMELVEQGRFPHVGALGMLRRRDDEAIQDAIGMTRLSEFVHRPIDTLSGGERQHRMIAMSAGTVVADGPPAEVLTPRLLRDCFGVEASVVPDPNTGSPMCIPHSPIFSDDEENAANG